MTEVRFVLYVGLGALALGVCLAVHSCCASDQPALPDGAPPIASAPTPTCDAGLSDDAGSADAQSDDAGPPAPLRPTGGPSCGTHPWCSHPKEPCCTDVLDCCD